MRTLIFSAIILGAALPALPAQSAVTVFGDSTAQKCFQSAHSGGAYGDLAACNEALKSRPLSRRDRAATLVNRGILLNRHKQAEAAIDDFNAALRIAGPLGEAYLNRGNSNFFLKRIKAALADYTLAIRHMDANLHIAYFNRGITHEVLGHIDEARRDFEKVLELRPGFAPARAMLSELDSGKGKGRPRHSAAAG